MDGAWRQDSEVDMADCWVYSEVKRVVDSVCLKTSRFNIAMLFSSVLVGSIGLCHCNTFCCVNASNSCTSI